MQQQNWSLEQLDKRDIIDDGKSVAAPPTEPELEEPELDEESTKAIYEYHLKKELARVKAC